MAAEVEAARIAAADRELSVGGALQRNQVLQRRGEGRDLRHRELVLHQQGAGGVGAEFQNALLVVGAVGVRRAAGSAEAAKTLGGAPPDQRPPPPAAGANGGGEGFRDS